MHYDKCCLEPCVLLAHANLWSFQSFQPPVLSKHLHLSMNSRGAAAVASKNHNTLIEGHCRMTLRRSSKGGSSHLRPCLGLSSKGKLRKGLETRITSGFSGTHMPGLVKRARRWPRKAWIAQTSHLAWIYIKGKKIKDSFLYDIQKTPLRIERTSRSSCQNQFPILIRKSHLSQTFLIALVNKEVDEHYEPHQTWYSESLHHPHLPSQVCKGSVFNRGLSYPIPLSAVRSPNNHQPQGQKVWVLPCFACLWKTKVLDCDCCDIQTLTKVPCLPASEGSYIDRFGLLWFGVLLEWWIVRRNTDTVKCIKPIPKESYSATHASSTL